MLEDDRPSRRLNSVPPPPDDSPIPTKLDWRPIAILALTLAFIGFAMWLYH